MTRWMYLALVPAFVGCSSGDSPTKLVSAYHEASISGDRDTAITLVDDPRFLREVDTFDFEYTAYRILGETDEGVRVGISIPCMKEMEYTSVLTTDSEGRLLIDFWASAKNYHAAKSGLEPKQKYCFPLKDQEMQGQIAGIDWRGLDVNSTVYDYGTHKEASLKIISEPCPDERCVTLTSPSILIDGLDLSSDGGNFTGTENITLYVPPSQNTIVTKGSYRVSRIGEKTKLEISFNKDADNHVNGYIVF